MKQGRPFGFFDNAAASFPDAETFARCAELAGKFGANQEAMGFHSAAASKALAKAEKKLLFLLCGDAAEDYSVFWTNTGTDAVNACFETAKRLMPALPAEQRTCLLSKGEHHSVYAASIRAFGKNSCESFRLKRDGAFDASDVKRLFSEKKFPFFLAALHHVQSETGAVQDVQEFRNVLDEASQSGKTLFFCDTIQSVGREVFGVRKVMPDFFTVSGQKLALPCGGAAVMKKKFASTAKILRTNEHLFGRVPAFFSILLTERLEKLLGDAEKNADNFRKLRKIFLDALTPEARKYVVPTIEEDKSSSRFLHLMMTGGGKKFQGAILTRAMAAKGFSIASGSACASETPEPSKVLRAMGYTKEEAFCAVRISFSETNTEEETRSLAEAFSEAVKDY